MTSALGGGRRIALLHPRYWPEVRRGSERFIHDLGSRLPRRGFEPTLITSHRERRSRTTEAGMTVVRRRRPPEWPLHRLGIWEHALHLPASYRSLRAGEFGLAHALYPTDALAANRWSRCSGRPSVLSVMGVPNREVIERSAWRASMWRRITAGADRVIFLSRYAAEASAWLTSGEVIEPGVDLELFRLGSERSARPRLFAPAAGEDPRKRVALLVEAVAVIRHRYPDLELLLGRVRGGRVPAGYDPATYPWIRTVDLDEHESLVHAYGSSWLTVHAAREEAFGLVLAESLAC
ncbi:MAG: glycosyltransferase, partial [Solirubrobacterales bacterium]